MVTTSCFWLLLSETHNHIQSSCSRSVKPTHLAPFWSILTHQFSPQVYTGSVTTSSLNSRQFGWFARNLLANRARTLRPFWERVNGVRSCPVGDRSQVIRIFEFKHPGVTEGRRGKKRQTILGIQRFRVADSTEKEGLVNLQGFPFFRRNLKLQKNLTAREECRSSESEGFVCLPRRANLSGWPSGLRRQTQAHTSFL